MVLWEAEISGCDFVLFSSSCTLVSSCSIRLLCIVIVSVSAVVAARRLSVWFWINPLIYVFSSVTISFWVIPRELVSVLISSCSPILISLDEREIFLRRVTLWFPFSECKDPTSSVHYVAAMGRTDVFTFPLFGFLLLHSGKFQWSFFFNILKSLQQR